MINTYLARQLVQLGLTANAIKPPRDGRTAVPAFFAGWLTAELAPQLITATAADAAYHLLRRGPRTRADRLALLAAGASIAGLAHAAAGGNRARTEVEDALVAALGVGYHDALTYQQTPADLAVPWRSISTPFLMRNPVVTHLRRLPYAPGGKRFEAAVFHRQDRPSGAPVLIQVHGGAWMIGENNQAMPLMLHMAARGWVCVSVNYPLSPRARWPDHLVALKRAVAWIRSDIAEYGGDASFLAATGGSAGGHLSSMLALTSDDRSLQPGFENADTSIQACVPHYGVYDFTDENGIRGSRERLRTLIRPRVMGTSAVYPEDYRAASPLSRITEGAPPFFVIHGTNDTLVPVEEAREFVARLRRMSTGPVAYAELRGAQHAFDLFPSIRSAHVVRGVERFLDWTHTRWLSRAADRAAVPQPR